VITLRTDLPDHVLGADASGTVTGQDYETVLVPAIEAFRRDHDKIRALVVLGTDFQGFEGGAMWDDAKLGLREAGEWERLAVVTDQSHMRTMINAFKFMIPGKVKTFELGQLDDAKIWVAQ
jgi:hypothetical protein